MSIVTAKKEHICETCGNMINPGEKYELFETRHPLFEMHEDEEGDQIGIEYSRMRFHLPELECHKNDQCKAGNHKYTSYEGYSDPNGYFEGVTVCNECGEEKQD